MTDDRRSPRGRREFIEALTLGGLAGLTALGARRASAEAPPETDRIRLTQTAAICTAPQLVSAELLKGEGFAQVEWPQGGGRPVTGALTEVASGAADIGITFSGPTIIQIDAGDPVTVLAGVHPGCFELFGSARVRSLKDLKGKKIAVIGLGSSPHVFLSSMLAHVGLDPRKDVEWIIGPRDVSVEASGTARWTPTWASRPSRRSCAPARSATWS
jgi:NitT/TauT family transport system substrate-binding protein